MKQSNNRAINLSVIIPTYNTKEMTADCIGSVIDYTDRADTEIIVVDSASSDNTGRLILKKFPLAKLIKLKKNLGFGYACNQGAKKAKGKYLCILNSDILFRENWLKKAKEVMENDETIGILAPRLVYQDGSLQKSAGSFPSAGNLLAWTFFVDDIPGIDKLIRAYHITDSGQYQAQKNFDWIQAACWLIRADIYSKIRFDTDFFMYAEDIDFAYRLEKLGLKSVYFPFCSVIHLAKGESGEGSIIGEYKGLLRFFRKHHSKLSSTLIIPLIWINAFIRWFGFGILTNDGKKKKIYSRALAEIAKL